MTNEARTIDKSFFRPNLDAEQFEGFLRFVPRFPDGRTSKMSQFGNRNLERLHRGRIPNQNNRVVRDGIAVQNFGAFVLVFHVIFGRVNKRTTFESCHSRDRLAGQKAFRGSDATKSLDGIANNFQAILTTIQHCFFEGIRFRSHDGLDPFATL